MGIESHKLRGRVGSTGITREVTHQGGALFHAVDHHLGLACAETKASIVSTRILGRRTAPIAPFLISHPRPTWFCGLNGSPVLLLVLLQRLQREGRRRAGVDVPLEERPATRGIFTRDYSPLLLISQGMALQLQGITRLSF